MAAKRRIELLAPARNLSCGLAAIDHGADAVYIGGPAFGARAAAANSVTDIATLAAAAHRFKARVYVALNTVLDDRQLEEAEGLAWKLYEAGVDALIVQDMGLLQCSLPPLPLHASTQCDNRSPEKVRFLEDVGFRQVVLARELTLAEIRRIRQATSVILEVFVHGALCVSYSGQCYISEVVAGRSANRGECAQFCRHRYTLQDLRGKVLAADRHLLSLKDLDLSRQLAALLAAGVDSFKIEGRLKDENYVKNVTAAYRLALDELLRLSPDLEPSSSGSCSFTFIPDTARSFNRGKTEYFLVDRRNSPGAPDSPKAIGQLLGPVRELGRDWFAIATDEELHNGDGLCFYDRTGTLRGLKVNRVAQGRIFAHGEPAGLFVGTLVFRNHDVAFAALLQRSGGCRRLEVRLSLAAVDRGVELTVTDEDGLASTTFMEATAETAAKPIDLAVLAERQLRRSGGTPFTVTAVAVDLPSGAYYPSALFNELRRRALARHLDLRIDAYRVEEVALEPNSCPWPGKTLDYRNNITSARARDFYRRHGAVIPGNGDLDAGEAEDCRLMTCRYCVRRQLSLCPRDKGQGSGDAEPLLLSDNTGEYLLVFACDRCEMTVTKRGKARS